MSSALWPLTKQIKLYNKCGGRKLLQQIWLQYCDSSNVFCLSRMCTDGKAVITHDSTSVSWSKAVPAVSTIHLALECDCLKVWNFMTQFPCRFFRSGIKWNCSQGDHVVLAETSMIRLTSNTSFISALTRTMAGNQLCGCVFCMCFYSLCLFWRKINAWKKKKITDCNVFEPCQSSSLQPGQLITSSHHWPFLHNNKSAINIYGNAAW